MRDSTKLAWKRVKADLGKIPYCGNVPLAISGCGLAVSGLMEGAVLWALFGVGIAGTSGFSTVLRAGIAQKIRHDLMAQDERSGYA